MKENKLVRWEKRRSVFRAGLGDLIFGAAWEAVAILLLLFVAVAMLSVESDEIKLAWTQNVRIAGIVLATVFFYEFGMRFLCQRIREGKRRSLIRILGKAIPAVIVLICFGRDYAENAENVRGGLAAIFQLFAAEYSELYGVNVVVLNADAAELESSLFFLVRLLFFAFYFPSVTGKRKWHFALFPLAATACLMYVGLAPSWGQILLSGAGILMISKCGKTKSAKAYAVIATAAFFMIFGILGIGFHSSADHLLQHSAEVKVYEEKLERSLKTMFTASSNKKAETIANAKPKYNDAEVMTVWTSKRPTENLYFKDFSGVDYENGKWNPQGGEFAALCEEQGFPAEQAVKEFLMEPLYKTSEQAKYRLTYKGQNQSMLLPYGADVNEIEELSIAGDGIAMKPRSLKEISFYGARKNELLEDVGNIVGSDVRSAYTAYWRDTYNYDQISAFWNWYNRYVEENYLSAPDYRGLFPEYDARSGALEYLQTIYRTEVTEWISLIMRGNHSTYSWNLDKLEDGEDAIEHFLKNGRKGYCIHFASAAVILLRNYGVPARYVSGYVVMPSAFVEQEDGGYAAKVIDRNAHAWVEIYLDYIGWIPVEMTPGYGDGYGELPTSETAQKAREERELAAAESEEEKAPEESVAQQLPLATEKPPVSDPEEASKESKASESDSGDEEGLDGFKVGKLGEADDEGGNPWPWYVVILGAILALVLLLVWQERKRLKEKQLERALRRKYYKGAAMIMNKRVHKRIRKKGAVKGPIYTDRELEKALLATLGEGMREEIAEYGRIVKAAAFSGEGITKEQCKVVWHVYGLVNKL